MLTVLIVATVFAEVSADENFRISRNHLKQAEIKYGERAVTKLLKWEEMIRATDRNKTDLNKLEKVNQFFNTRMMYVADMDLWGVEDYWATPFEFLSRSAGDCEDFAIAKYFTLKAMGVKEDRLNIMYVKSLRCGSSHMVLAYYETPKSEPLILDNSIDCILAASQRKDLLPVFSFNASGLWSSRQKAQGSLSGRTELLKPWQDLLEKMQ
ncbi:transglutaminase-like cysteine peptidase [Desulfonatronum parangueonense]